MRWIALFAGAAVGLIEVALLFSELEWLALGMEFLCARWSLE